MINIASLSQRLIVPKVKRKLQQIRYVLSDRTDLEKVRPWPLPLGYDRIYYYHIPNTGGTVLNYAFKNAYAHLSASAVDEEAQVARDWSVFGGRLYVSHNEYLLERGDFFYGDGHGAFHEVAIPANTFKITILRDPASRALSYYRMLWYWKQNDIKHPARKEAEAYLGTSFYDFLDRVPRKHLMRQLYMFSENFDVAEAARNIATLNFVMTIERFSEHLRTLAELLDIDLRLYMQKSRYGAVTLRDADRERLLELLAPEYTVLEAVAPLIGAHLHGGQSVRAADEAALEPAAQSARFWGWPWEMAGGPSFKHSRVEEQVSLREVEAERRVEAEPPTPGDNHSRERTNSLKGRSLWSRTVSRHRGPPSTTGPDSSDAPPPRRIIDANLLADRFMVGEIATLTVSIRLPHNRPHGRWQGQADIDPCGGPIRVRVEAKGFQVVSQPPPDIDVPEDRDAPPVAFELLILEPGERWLHVLVTQQGRPVGELAIHDFSSLGAAPVQQAARSRVRALAEADLTLVVRDDKIDVYSPRERACLCGVTMPGFKYPDEPFRKVLRNRLRALYDEDARSEDIARDLQIYGVELARALPVSLRELLRRPDIRSVMVRHEHDFEFPVELCYLDDVDDPFFIGDRIAVCRWYMGVTNPPDITVKSVRKAAFLKGTDLACGADEYLLAELYPGRTVTFTRRGDVIEQLFKTADFDLIHFTGHCRVDNEGMGGLEFMDGSFLRLLDIGQLAAERAFTSAHPFIMVNACSSGQPYVALTSHDSFPYRFVTSQACAFVGTLWPVSGPVANEFARRLYLELARKPIGGALLAAKKAILSEYVGQQQEPTSKQALARQVALRSYCLFANPDLRLA